MSDIVDVDGDRDARRRIEALARDGRRVETGGAGTRLVWHRWGEGPALVLLHGGSGSWTHWLHTVDHFAGDHHVLAADLPGLGDSAMPAQPYSATSLADILSGDLDELLPGRERFELVGFSFGGILGAHVAVRQADRIRGLTIVGSPPFGLGSTGPANEVSAVDPSLSLQAAAGLHRRNLGLLMFADHARIDSLALRVHHDNLRRARLRSRKIARTDTLARALRETTCRVRGIWGERDVTIHPSMEALRALFAEVDPSGTFDVLDGVGHWAAFEAPERFNGLLERRLRPST